jgi:chemotaxis protein methyltransferase WspC
MNPKLNQIIHLVESRLGLKPHSTRVSKWEQVVEERMTLLDLSTYEDYWKWLSESQDEVQELIEHIIIPETWFFRDKGAFNFVSQWIAQTQNQTSLFRVLSLACSTGEEPYSIAMTFLEAGLSRQGFFIDAIDISKKALAKALLGIYGKYSFRGKDLSYRDKYFDKTSIGYAIKDQVKEPVRFYYGNVLNDQIFLNAQFYHLIFCRNLLIYLNRDAQLSVLNCIKSLLVPQGILIVSPAEAQIASSAGFMPAQVSYTYALKIRPNLQTQSKRIAQMSSVVFTPKPLPSVPSEPKVELPSPIPLPSSQKEDPKNLLLQEAITLADAGAFEESMQLCFKFIYQYGAHPEVYYLLGLIHQALRQEEKAEDFFQKAVYLRPSYYEALICLALLYEKKGDLRRAELFRQRARKNV